MLEKDANEKCSHFLPLPSTLISSIFTVQSRGTDTFDLTICIKVRDTYHDLNMDFVCLIISCS